jgi:NADH-quinone oxidoreductase subunit A
MGFEPSTITLFPWEPSLLSLMIYSFFVLLLIAAILFLSAWLGEKKPTQEKSTPYECGVLPTGSAWFRYPIPFYLIAAFFLIFDVEAVYIFSWAIAFQRLGWAGWCQITFFILILLLTLFYLWKKGGLEWQSTPES